MGVGGALGLPIAAAVAEVNWRLLFWGSTALAVLIATLIFKLVPATPVARNTSGFDYVGAVGLGAGLVCLLLGVSKGADWGWGSATTVGLLVASVVILLVWAGSSSRSTPRWSTCGSPARPVVLLTNVASLVVGFSMYAQSLIIPQLMQMPKATGFGLGESMLAMGLWMMPGGLVMMLVSPLGAKLSHLRGPKVTLAVGSFVVSLGYVAAVLMMGSAFTLMLAVCIGSAGVGLAYGAMPALIMGRCRSRRPRRPTASTPSAARSVRRSRPRSSVSCSPR